MTEGFDHRPAGSQPRLSIVCAMRNGAATLPAMLASWASQDRTQAELIAIDALSTDATWSLVRAPGAMVSAGLREADRGIYDAWNKALPLCRGEYVAFLGCDDVLAAGAVGALQASIERLPAEDAQRPHVLAGFNVLTRQRLPVALVGEPFRAERLPRRMMVAHVMAAHRLQWLKGVGGFDASYRSSGDYQLLLRERAGLRVETLPTVLTYVEDGGTSRSLLRPHLENYRARTGAGIGRITAASLFARAMVFTGLRLIGLKR